MNLDENVSLKEGEKVTELIYKAKNYRFSTEDLAVFPISAILGALFLYVFFIGVLGHWVLYAIGAPVPWLLNMFGIKIQLSYTFLDGIRSWVFTGDIPTYIFFLPDCSGFPAFAIFIALICATPASKDPTAKRGIWWRKVISIIVSCFLYHIINVLRMTIQLYLYHENYPWPVIHYSIGVEVAVIAGIIILLMYRWIPELPISIIIIGMTIKQEIHWHLRSSSERHIVLLMIKMQWLAARLNFPQWQQDLRDILANTDRANYYTLNQINEKFDLAWDQILNESKVNNWKNFVIQLPYDVLLTIPNATRETIEKYVANRERRLSLTEKEVPTIAEIFNWKEKRIRYTQLLTISET